MKMLTGYGGAKINATLGFDYRQALRAAEAGAHVYSLFMGRMQAQGEDAVGVAKRIIERYIGTDAKIGFLAASMRTPELVIDSWKAGADIATAPPSVLEELVKDHPLNFESMRAEHPEERHHMPRLLVIPRAHDEAEFKHPLLEPGLKKFIADAASVGYDLLASKT